MPAGYTNWDSGNFPKKARFKRLIFAADGTWVNANRDKVKPGTDRSNVTYLLEAIRPISRDAIQQIQYYHPGVGTSGLSVERVIDGITAVGLGEDVREGYNFIASNWIRDDEIFLFGFSRGAYTARAIAGLIGEIGLLTTRGLRYLPDIYADVKRQHDPHYVSKNPNVPFPNKPSFRDPRYLRELHRHGLTSLHVPIKAVGVWETVGALGLPSVRWAQPRDSHFRHAKFYDTRLSNCVQYAFQALALDEKRFGFVPALWEKAPGNKTVLRQVWFPGVHSNVGGGFSDAGLSNITLAWMMAQILPLLDISTRGLFIAERRNQVTYDRPWAFGKIYTQLTGIYTLAGSKARTPGAYRAIDPVTGRETDRPLRDTHEYVHPSVRVRMLLHGLGPTDRGDYNPRALKNRRLIVRRNKTTGFREVYWKYDRQGRSDRTKEYLPECPLHALEQDLLAICENPEVERLALDLSFRKGRQTRATGGHVQR